MDTVPRTVVYMVMENWKEFQVEQFSPVRRISGYPWRLRIYKGEGKLCNVSLICEKSSEAELWQCDVTIKCVTSNVHSASHSFTSWDENGHQCMLRTDHIEPGKHVVAKLMISNDGEMWTRRPSLDPLAPRDGILVIGKHLTASICEKMKIQVNKQSLASVSPYFDRLFNGDFKEKNMTEISIEEVEYEDFSNIIRIIYGFEGASITDVKVSRVLQLADRFQIKIVEDRAVSYLLSPSSSLSIQLKLFIAEHHNLPFLKDTLLKRNLSNDEMKELSNAPDLMLLSKETIVDLFKKSCDFNRQF